ncbi:MAG: tRNA 2-thiouridine(34) synthase MnmA [Planctomycetales bacterium]|nr:tRNA 2-thiouridine(34) synthase MnmA [Planctomycetales bacterium]
MSRVVLAMSGGVDSSVAAQLLLEQGHEVLGVFMRHGEEALNVCRVGGMDTPATLQIVDPRAAHKQGCCSASDAEDARRVADRLEIPFYALNLQREFARIIDYFVDEYTRARTPNPCVMCNNWIKFGKLFDYADSVDAEFVATGHYARLEPAPDSSRGDEPRLLRGVDSAKDQSYVLFGIERARLSRMLLPVGSYTKSWIRARATELGFGVAEKKDSQEICFVTAGQHGEFVARRRGEGNSTAGEIVTTDGRVVGRHEGIERFTIGQRKGLGVAMGEPYFVVRIEAATRRVVIGLPAALGRRQLEAADCNWLVDLPNSAFHCHAQIRYNSPPQPASAEVLADGRLSVTFDEPQRGVAPGQAVVCYDGDQVLGGGWIEG